MPCAINFIKSMFDVLHTYTILQYYMYRMYYIVISEHFRIIKLYTFIIRYRIEIKVSKKYL